jgi:hypothetical protein
MTLVKLYLTNLVDRGVIVLGCLGGFVLAIALFIGAPLLYPLTGLSPFIYAENLFEWADARAKAMRGRIEKYRKAKR